MAPGCAATNRPSSQTARSPEPPARRRNAAARCLPPPPPVPVSRHGQGTAPNPSPAARREHVGIQRLQLVEHGFRSRSLLPEEKPSPSPPPPLDDEIPANVSPAIPFSAATSPDDRESVPPATTAPPLRSAPDRPRSPDGWILAVGHPRPTTTSNAAQSTMPAVLPPETSPCNRKFLSKRLPFPSTAPSRRGAPLKKLKIAPRSFPPKSTARWNFFAPQRPDHHGQESRTRA